MIADKDMSGDRRNRGDRGHFGGGGPPGVQSNFNNEFDNNSQPGGNVIEVRKRFLFIKALLRILLNLKKIMLVIDISTTCSCWCCNWKRRRND